ncbi:MAG: MarC family protein [Hydrogenophilaceae bacterium]
MPIEWHDYVKMFVGLLVILNPMLAVPVFISLTDALSDRERLANARRTALAVGIVLSVAALLGQQILDLFGISIDSFRVGGGLLILLMAVSMMHAKMSGARHTEMEEEEAQARADVAVVPLAIPILAGPGAISTAIIYAHRDLAWMHAVLIGEIWLAALLVWLTLRSALPISRTLGTTGINIATRLMGLVLAALAVEFIVNGLKGMWLGQ